MATTGLVLNPVTPGDYYPVDHSDISLPSGTVISGAAMGLKRYHADTALVAGIPEKVITTSFVAGLGGILNAGSLVQGVWTIEVRFEFTTGVGGDTYLLLPYVGGKVCYYINFTAAGQTFCVEIGELPVLSGGKYG